MSRRHSRIIQPLLTWLGGRSRRERFLLGATLLIILAIALGGRFIMGPYRDFARERIRLRASKTQYEKLEQLLERQDEIMSQAAGLVQEYLKSRDQDAATLLLSRIDAKRTNRTVLLSVYPLQDEAQMKRFRVKLQGPPGDLGRLFFALGEGAPPIIMKELALSAGLLVEDVLSATAMLEVEQKTIPEEWIRAFSDPNQAKKPAGATSRVDGRLPAASAQRKARPAASKPFPFNAIERHGIFQTGKAPQDKRLETAAPTIQTMMQDLSLSGVIWGKNPKALIADKATKETHYRTVGQFIGELEVIEITRNSVTLRYKDEEGRLE